MNNDELDEYRMPVIVRTADERIAELEAHCKLLRDQHERFGLGIDEFHRNISNKLVKATPQQSLNEVKAQAIEEALSEILIHKTSNTALIHAAELLEYAQKLRE